MADPYLALLAAQVRGQLQYRVSFVLDVASQLAVAALDLSAVLVLFRVTPALGGFAVGEVVLMVGLSGTAFAAADLAVGSVERLRLYVRTGLFDTVLIRPLGALAQLVALDFQLRRIGRLLAAAAVLAVGAAWPGVDWTGARVALAVLAVLGGAAFFSALFVAGATVAFWWIESGEVANAFTYGGRDFTSYPVTIYQGWFRRLFAFGLGFGFVAYYPSLAVLGRPDPLGAPAWVAWTAPLVAVPAMVAAGLVWRTGVRHYRSTGS